MMSSKHRIQARCRPEILAQSTQPHVDRRTITMTGDACTDRVRGTWS